MHIGSIVKRNDELSLKLYDEDLNLLEDESFSDVFSLNFFLQTLPRKYHISKTLLIVHNQRLNRVDMQIATNENSYYITWYMIHDKIAESLRLSYLDNRWHQSAELRSPKQ